MLINKLLELNEVGIHLFVTVSLRMNAILTQYDDGLKILSTTESFWRKLKCEQKALCIAITDSPVLKKHFNSQGTHHIWS